ncbi:MAG TPA: NifB/NifX family molybdenum-iron cluster-binding protein [Spirochaetales bacterium]|nr:NifB/NifX family molybdenum-iron cluster-binding protein [Spirochaetales bacterium]HRY54617.1 NifB/NifX family molybdenum-iron cluster-binding protein [Spirochaetia bacterium]HRZ64440.1 NifB/NifX family molybdenum-iron cluster-binding protein [Spirochaetia bacterium]
MKYAIPTDDGATLSSVFGRAASFAIFASEAAEPEIKLNGGAASEHGAGTGAAAFLAERGVEVVVCPELGPKAQAALSSAGIRVAAAKAGLPLREAVAAARASR